MARSFGSRRSIRARYMRVSRSDDSCFDSIHRDNWVTGANAMSVSLDGSGAFDTDRTNRSLIVTEVTPGSGGFHTVAGASASVSATVRGPVRRSKYCAMDDRHDSAAC